MYQCINLSMYQCINLSIYTCVPSFLYNRIVGNELTLSIPLISFMVESIFPTFNPLEANLSARLSQTRININKIKGQYIKGSVVLKVILLLYPILPNLHLLKRKENYGSPSNLISLHFLYSCIQN